MRKIEVAIVGIHGSGKTALVRHLKRAAASVQDVEFCFDEHHSHNEMDCEHHDVVLQVVDAMHLRESMVLTPSFIDHEHHLVLAINQYDLLRRTGHALDLPRFRELIGVPVETVSSATGEGTDALFALILEAANRDHTHAQPVVHGWEQTDEEAFHAWMEGILAQTLIHPENDLCTWEERINRLLTHPLTGFPILALILCLVFWCTFTLGDPLGEWIDAAIGWLHDLCISHLPNAWYTSMLSEGVILGVGSLLSALPNIIILFFFLSVMEDTGYMARVSYLMDRIMHAVGLHGRSFIPMLMGFDCNVPAIMAAKDLNNPKDRTLTMLMVPFMSCSARLPVYILFIDVFFAHYKGLVLGSLYLIGILLSFAFAWLMKRTRWFRGEHNDTVNELPDFRLPTLQSIGRHIWYRVADFLQKISTVVLCASIIIWALEYFPAHDLEHIETSYLAMIGHWLEPLMQPLGFDWRLSVCLLTGLPAKEAIAATFAILFTGGVESTGLTAISAYAFLCFTLLYFPCVATISTLRRETNWKWAAFSVIHSLILAWLVAFLVNYLGTLFVG